MSSLILFVEMLLIRWLSTEIRIFAYVQNLILVVCFLGLGVGCLLKGNPLNLIKFTGPLSFLVLILSIPASRQVLADISTSLAYLPGLIIWNQQIDPDWPNKTADILVGAVLLFGVSLVLWDIFAPLGRLLGYAFDLLSDKKRLIQAYTVNILGSLFGTLLFAALSFYEIPPQGWFLCLFLLFAAFCGENRLLDLKALIMMACLPAAVWLGSAEPGALEQVWSPYQKLVLRRYSDAPNSFDLKVNNTSYQALLDLSPENRERNRDAFAPYADLISQYDLPFLLHPSARNALIVGGGAGNDAAGALRHDLAEITVVDIDPSIIALGRKHHPEKPYDSPRVTVVNDDARAFFQKTHQHFDLIIFGLLDSHTTPALTNLRLDNYVYTVESLTQAQTLLNPDGVLILTFAVGEYRFIADRLAGTLHKVFSKEPLIIGINGSPLG